MEGGARWGFGEERPEPARYSSAQQDYGDGRGSGRGGGMRGGAYGNRDQWAGDTGPAGREGARGGGGKAAGSGPRPRRPLQGDVIDVFYDNV